MLTVKTFPQLFKKYRLRGEFETFSDFGDALGEKGYFYDDSIFSHWQKGARIPSNRQLLLTILAVFIERQAITSQDEANELLASTGLGYLTEEEKKKFFVDTPLPYQASKNYYFFDKLNRLMFITLAIIGISLFSIYSFIDIQNTLIFFAFWINLGLALLLYFQAKKTPALVCFLFTAFGICAWCLSMIFYRATSTADSILAAKLVYASPVVAPTTFLLSGLLFPNRKVNKIFVAFLLFLTLLVLIVTLTKGLVIKNVIIPTSGENIEIYGWAYYWIYAIYFPVLFISGYVIFLKKYLKGKGEEKMQLLFILIGMSAASIPAIFTNLFFPLFGIIQFDWMGPLFSVFWIIGIYLAISKYRLFNLHIKMLDFFSKSIFFPYNSK